MEMCGITSLTVTWNYWQKDRWSFLKCFLYNWQVLTDCSSTVSVGCLYFQWVARCTTLASKPARQLWKVSRHVLYSLTGMPRDQVANIILAHGELYHEVCKNLWKVNTLLQRGVILSHLSFSAAWPSETRHHCCCLHLLSPFRPTHISHVSLCPLINSPISCSTTSSNLSLPTALATFRAVSPVVSTRQLHRPGWPLAREDGAGWCLTGLCSESFEVEIGNWNLIPD